MLRVAIGIPIGPMLIASGGSVSANNRFIMRAMRAQFSFVQKPAAEPDLLTPLVKTGLKRMPGM
jgi:hypothetical protein